MKTIVHSFPIILFALVSLLFSSCEKLSLDNNSVFPKGERVFYSCNLGDIKYFDAQEYSLFQQEVVYALSEATTESLYGRVDQASLVKKLDAICAKYNNKSLYGTLVLTGSSESVPAHTIKSWTLSAAGGTE